MSQAKREHILLLTGKLAEKSLTRVLESMADTPFTWRVHELGLSVAGLMTAEMITRRLPDPMGADRVLVPGRCRGDLDAVSRALGVPVVRGPEELADLPQFFGRKAAAPDLAPHPAGQLRDPRERLVAIRLSGGVRHGRATIGASELKHKY